MAIAGCENCGRPTRNVKEQCHPEPYGPLGHPNSGIVCGKPRCENPGLIWLNVSEARDYAKGQRVFGIHTQTAKARLE